LQTIDPSQVIDASTQRDATKSGKIKKNRNFLFGSIMSGHQQNVESNKMAV
jgi:hypothetical protein